MRSVIFALLLFSALSPSTIAQNNPRSLHIEGPPARRLISLLVTGNASIASPVKDNGSTRILLHHLNVMKYSTDKYDEDSPNYRLDVYAAYTTTEVGSKVPIFAEATALYELLSSLGVRAELSMQGTDLEVDTVDCRINTNVPFDRPQRFICNLGLPL